MELSGVEWCVSGSDVGNDVMSVEWIRLEFISW